MRGVHARMSQLAVDDVANKSMAPLSVDEVVRVSHKCKVPPFGHKVIHGSVGLVLQGYRMNVMTHGLEKRSPLLPLGIDISHGQQQGCGGIEKYHSGLDRNQKRYAGR